MTNLLRTITQQLSQQQTAGGRGGDQTRAKRSLQWSSAVVSRVFTGLGATGLAHTNTIKDQFYVV